MQTLVLAATTSKIVGVLAGAITTTQPDFTVHYADDTGSAFTEGYQGGTFNSTTQADICTAPAASTRRVIKNIVVYNRDTASVTFTLKYSENGTLRFLTTQTLAVGAYWDFSPVKGDTGATGAAGGVKTVCGRLTLTSGTPVTTSDVTGATNVYWTPYKGNQMPLYDGVSTWTILSPSETTLALGTLTSGKNYDVFAFNNSGTMALEALAWTSDTARATALVLQDGLYVKTGATTRLYLGTFRTTSTTATEDSGGGVTSQTGGKRFLWNMYNRVSRFMSVIDTTDSWNYTTATWRQGNNAAGNKVEYLAGLNEDAVSANLTVVILAASSAASNLIGIGLDTITVAPRITASYFESGGSSSAAGVTAIYDATAGLGYHYLSWMEKGSGTTATFFGDNAAAFQSGLNARVMG